MEILVDTRDFNNVPAELTILWHFEDERPLKGLAALLDWRLDGMFSKLILDGRISGQWGEKVLMGAFKAMPGKRLILMGEGAKADFSRERTRDAGRLVVRTLQKLKAETAHVSLPGDGIADMDIVEIAEDFLDGIVHENAAGSVRPRILCSEDNVDEVLLGFQKTKVKLKDSFHIDIIQVK